MGVEVWRRVETGDTGVACVLARRGDRGEWGAAGDLSEVLDAGVEGTPRRPRLDVEGLHRRCHPVPGVADEESMELTVVLLGDAYPLDEGPHPHPEDGQRDRDAHGHADDDDCGRLRGGWSRFRQCGGGGTHAAKKNGIKSVCFTECFNFKLTTEFPEPCGTPAVWTPAPPPRERGRWERRSRTSPSSSWTSPP